MPAERTMQAKRQRAQDKAPAASSTDVTAPARFTRSWVMENPEAFRQLSKPPDECPVCLETFKGTRRKPFGPVMGDRPTNCRHYACRGCWMELKQKLSSPWHCPVCKENVTDWLDESFKTRQRQPPLLLTPARMLDYMAQTYTQGSMERLIAENNWELVHMGAWICRTRWGTSEYCDRLPDC